MDKQLIIYGCYGYTGKLIVEEALSKGLKPVLSGRDTDKVSQMAAQYGLISCPFTLTTPEQVSSFLSSGSILLNCAGPFVHTADILVKACLLAQCHYLDITGEYQIFESLSLLDVKAKDRGILIMPGTGFDVVPSDCLSGILKDKLPIADSLQLCLISAGGSLSHGTALTVLENAGTGTMTRRKGKLVNVPSGKLVRKFEWTKGKYVTGAAISWGDISTAFLSTGIPNITVYNALPEKVIRSMAWMDYLRPLIQWGPVKRFLQNRIKSRPAGPDSHTRKTARMFIWGEVSNEIGGFKRYLLETPEGYTLTAKTSVDIARRLIIGEVRSSGFQTPAQLFGSRYILEFDGVKLTSLNGDDPSL